MTSKTGMLIHHPKAFTAPVIKIFRPNMTAAKMTAQIQRAERVK